MTKIVWTVGAACVLLVSGIFFFFDKEENAVKKNPVERVLAEQTAASKEVRAITAEAFQKSVADYTVDPMKFIGSRPCVVDFYATWCGPCKKLAPIMEQMAGKYEGQIDFYKVDVDKVPELAEAYGIQSIPTLLFCYDGKVEGMVGAPDKAQLEQKLNEMK